ncbi:acyl transferase [Aureibacter tunicatorum]|uniref:Phenylacetate-coenzyme A ligase PaaK-like adenylate-forming protein n=1 Tax=Aureibacter tunicatorum TaxID=866807 RepID=A0AAE3XPM6_9BACT|nr:acyl transferase [Aureibacter tunicatorum]MDR6240363.1 phenylacetate-coenzyme A ligase PaaK-like adenylate-forming protein [Aureibacter tunicatorum]BDD05756.1 acyltransferase [Aureibacter tunicatorum]
METKKIINEFKYLVSNIKNHDFDKVALELFRFQAKHNPVYSEYLQFLKTNPEDVKSIYEIPFLPISFFKTHQVKTGEWPTQKIFESSGTTGTTTSKHYVEDIEFYHKIATQIFTDFYSAPNDYIILALLPSYLERDNSSLVSMAKHFIDLTQDHRSGFYLNEFESLKEACVSAESTNKNVLLMGVTFGLLDFAELHTFSSSNITIMETGGMKGRRKEMIRAEVHEELGNSFGQTKIHSEYGMTELLSQAYSHGDGIFEMPSTMRILLRDVNDPFSVSKRTSGGINVIDLANIHSCSFIETQDLGKLHDNKFEVLGRFDNSDIRGCNLMTI